MLVTLLGIVIEDNFEQLAKALSPILVTLDGIVILVTNSAQFILIPRNL